MRLRWPLSVPRRAEADGRPPGKRRQKAREIASRPATAEVGLRLAQAWADELEAGGITQADIARREGVSRARVTQMLALLDLDEAKRAELLRGDLMWSIRRALREVGRHYR